MKTFGALAAAQMALLPISGAHDRCACGPIGSPSDSYHISGEIYITLRWYFHVQNVASAQPRAARGQHQSQRNMKQACEHVCSASVATRAIVVALVILLSGYLLSVPGRPFGGGALTFLMCTGPAMADVLVDVLPKSAVSQEARDELNAKTSALPSLKETVQNAGDALTGDRDVAGDVKKVRCGSARCRV